MLNKILNYINVFVSAVFVWILQVSYSWIQKLRRKKTPAEKLRNEMQHAKTYVEWRKKAQELDNLLANDEWKQDPVSPYYDYIMIQKRLDDLKSVRESDDVLSMIYMLRSGLLRNLGGINDPRLFSRSYLGTKKLIEDYGKEVVTQLEYIIGEKDFLDNSQYLYSKSEFFNDTRQSFGCTALVLYGGATFGLYHLGVVKALYSHGLLPRIISGTAIGALIAALVCIRTDEELPSIFEEGGVDLGAFAKKGKEGHIKRKISRFLKHGYFMDVRVLEECVRNNLGDLTFEEAFARTNRILNITVSPTRKFEVPQLLNYLTAPNVLIRTAACASAAMMGLYDTVDLLAKDKAGNIVQWNPTEIKWKKWTDTLPSENESPLNRISELFNVNHFIFSQANPYIAPFMAKEQFGNNILIKCGHLLSSEFRHRINQLEHMRILPKMFRGFVDEKVSGNITIVPYLSFSDFKTLLSNPDNSSLDYWILKGEQSTWSMLALIRNRCLVELPLDRIYLKLKAERPNFAHIHANRENGKKRTRTKSIH